MTLEQAGITVTASMTQPTRPEKAHRQVWEVSGNVFGYESELYDLGAKKWRGKFSFWEDPTEKLEELVAQGRKSFAERQDAATERAADRAERLTERADKHQQAADSAYEQARRIGDMIPMGQPILVGHHSEGRHRRDIDRIDRNMRKAHESREYAEELERRAEYNERKAAGDLKPSYVQNRIDEAEANVRKISGWADGDEQGQALLAEWQERAAYWKEQLEAIGGIAFGKHNITKGERVRTTWGWAVVVRANAKTCNVEFEADNMRGLGGPIKWTDIHEKEATD